MFACGLFKQGRFWQFTMVIHIQFGRWHFLLWGPTSSPAQMTEQLKSGSWRTTLQSEFLLATSVMLLVPYFIQTSITLLLRASTNKSDFGLSLMGRACAWCLQLEVQFDHLLSHDLATIYLLAMSMAFSFALILTKLFLYSCSTLAKEKQFGALMWVKTTQFWLWVLKKERLKYIVSKRW